MDCKAGNLDLITQIIRLLEEIHAEDYARHVELLGGVSIGQHFRHILDFYQCLLRDVPSGMVNYARRERNPLMETKPYAARLAFEAVISSMRSLDENRPLQIRGDFPVKDADGEQPVLSSSIGRELMYAHDHAVHHLALIRIGMREAAPEVTIDSALGYAPATLQYRAGQ